MQADQPPRPTCRRDGCNNKVTKPAVPRQWPKYCSERCRSLIYENRHPGRKAKSSAMIAYIDVWRKTMEWAGKHPPFELSQLPLGPGQRPKPLFTESGNMGLTQDDLDENVVYHIGRWQHLVYFINNTAWRQHLVRPNGREIAYLFTTFMYEDGEGSAHRIMPWVWDVMPDWLRYLVRTAWTQYTQVKGNSLDETTILDINQQNHQYYVRGRDILPGKSKEHQEDYLRKLSDKLSPANPFQCMANLATPGERNGYEKKEWDRNCREFLKSARECPPPASALPEDPAPVRKGGRRESGKAATGRRN